MNIKLTLFILTSLIILPILAQQKKAPTNKEFAVYDLYIETTEELSSWQIDCRYNKENLQITGIEGGDTAFAKPADYDSRGLASGRIILATYSLDKKLPNGLTKICRLHIYEKDAEFSKTQIKLIVAANGAGKAIQGKISFKKVEQN